MTCNVIHQANGKKRDENKKRDIDMHMGSQAGRYVKIDMLEGKFASQQIDFYES